MFRFGGGFGFLLVFSSWFLVLLFLVLGFWPLSFWFLGF